jgi:uncharacterized protein
MTRTQIQFPDPLYQRLKEIAEPLWNWAAKAKTGFRHIIDARLALTLRHHRVTHFANANAKHFEGFGFEKVWNSL